LRCKRFLAVRLRLALKSDKDLRRPVKWLRWCVCGHWCQLGPGDQISDSPEDPLGVYHSGKEEGGTGCCLGWGRGQADRDSWRSDHASGLSRWGGRRSAGRGVGGISYGVWKSRGACSCSL